MFCSIAITPTPKAYKKKFQPTTIHFQYVIATSIIISVASDNPLALNEHYLVVIIDFIDFWQFQPKHLPN